MNDDMQAQHDELVKTLTQALDVLKSGPLSCDYRAIKLSLWDASGMANQLGVAQFDAGCAADVQRCIEQAQALKGY